jgi:hypothetical protein
MKHHIVIDDKSTTGKYLLGVATALSKTDKTISVSKNTPSEEYVLNGIEQGFREVKEMINGKRKKKTLRDLLKENGV